MDTTTLSNALKAVFGTTITSSTSGVANFLAPLFNASGDPAGRIGMSDLASVLGGSFIKTLSGSVNLNDYRISQMYFLLEPASASNKPSGLGSDRGFMSVFQNGSYVAQLIYDQDGQQFWRWGLANGTYWDDWQTIENNIPSFYKDYASLSELSTALNIFKNNKLSDIPDSQTLNSTFSSGIYQVGYSQHYGVLVVFSTSYYIMQLYIDNGGQFKKRINTGNNPDAWVGDTI